ncbi:MAG: YebC/PmpR family DNA-binding transcriptional regulator [Deltaproteobacteria bacterium CG_4_10_14_3_um_filter_60_8]|nr:MAG: transcriptional regulator [Desulfobacterales bacterium CG2_30_60_27]PIP43826.1 MAG: YebC/PmpR family DNA-binding transcriptional regulator [Deltaproteobacteria bacterium CG23_combo_of_CG06-09_8_20_14_all_60_8]PIY21128.1 MAG: YebC/PmpR family DNA-binding transcriptional regulator [Deltaproteobacteria bacterium CG_4_10_14_3_um_filter_60_8]
MSGHSKWANIKHRKGAADAKKGKVFFKLIKEITVAARLGGGDVNANPRLRSGVAAAKAENMPKDNIDRAIKKGAGGLDGTVYEEITYEGYGPGGVAILVECMTDNKVRTVAEVRFLLSKAGGNLGETNCVSWMFKKKGSMMVDKGVVDEEKLVDIALEAGAEDVVEEDSEFQVLTDPEQFIAVKEALEGANIPFSDAAVTMIPENVVEVTEEKVAGQILRLLEKIEDNDDVQNVYANFDIPDEIVERLG